MQKLEKLYKIDSLGKLREWTMVIDGDSFHAEKGLVGGKIVCDKPTTAIGKNEGKVNETTNEEQALLEAQARWDKKLKEGYARTPKEAVMRMMVIRKFFNILKQFFFLILNKKNIIEIYLKTMFPAYNFN